MTMKTETAGEKAVLAEVGRFTVFADWSFQGPALYVQALTPARKSRVARDIQVLMAADTGPRRTVAHYFALALQTDFAAWLGE